MADTGDTGRQWTSCEAPSTGLLGGAARRIFWPLAAMMAIIAVAKLWLIGHVSSPTPFWDQWDAEAAGLYKPYLEGTLSFGQMFASHNEHRLVWTRLLSLGLIELVGRWEPQVQMVVNVFLHVAGIGMLAAWLLADTKPGRAWLIALGTGLLFAVPYGWENTLAGFQSQFYLLLMFTIACLSAGHDAAAFRVRWWASLALGTAAFFAMASGVIALLVLSAFHLLQMVRGERSGRAEYAGLAILAVVAIFLFSLVPAVPHHAPLKSQSLLQYVFTAAKIGAWPNSTAIEWLAPEWSRRLGFRQFVTFIVLAVVVHLPLGIALLSSIRRPHEGPSPPKAAVLLGAWVLVQIAGIAYARALGALSSRYIDLIAVGIVVNAVCLLYLSNPAVLATLKWRLVAAGWLVAVGTGAVVTGWIAVPAEIGARHEQTMMQTSNMKAFLLTGDRKWLADTRYLAVPYPNAARLEKISTDPTVRSILPRAILPPEEARAANPRLWLGSQLPPLARCLLLALALAGLLWAVSWLRSMLGWRTVR